MNNAKGSIVWSRDAESDLLEIWSRLAREGSRGVADHQLWTIERTTKTLSDWPQADRARDELIPGLRSVVVNPYVIFYRAAAAAVEIIRVLHQRREIDALLANRPER